MTLYEYYNTGDDDFIDIYGTGWEAQTFTVGTVGANEDHNITSVRLLMNRDGLPGTITVGIRATDASGYPTGSDLTSGTIDGDTLSTTATWYEITLTPYTLTAGTTYAIVVRAPTGDGFNVLEWWADSTSPTYTGGERYTSSDSGTTWTSDSTYDFMFEEYGTGSAKTFLKPCKIW